LSLVVERRLSSYRRLPLPPEKKKISGKEKFEGAYRALCLSRTPERPFAGIRRFDKNSPRKRWAKSRRAQGEHRSKSKIDMDKQNLPKGPCPKDDHVLAVSCHNHASVFTCPLLVPRFVVDVSTCLPLITTTMPLFFLS
jgi:hypothetical protein